MMEINNVLKKIAAHNFSEIHNQFYQEAMECFYNIIKEPEIDGKNFLSLSKDQIERIEVHDPCLRMGLVSDYDNLFNMRFVFSLNGEELGYFSMDANFDLRVLDIDCITYEDPDPYYDWSMK